ncbi:prolyl 4-hydroxylase [Seminavis robusta]|uniref:Prolyl 4-hydroxylase n=1 Tax=Seminavis robusta TaxID=568900 RepID=A0A9N8EB77_9STRA|nr:prolyl 4-hydroxylase [Seminavis robusta]|eukprot:Sro758_g198050.1 prolyl 4-hydroxylase (540) ;mRNA; f:21734-23353
MIKLSAFVTLLLASVELVPIVQGARTRRSERRKMNLDSLEYVEYPRRTEDEAAVLEWGHSAIISALDASVAFFGPQTSQAALLEVECMPILASPLTGVREGETLEEEEEEEPAAEGEEGEEGETAPEEKPPKKEKILPLDNAEEVHGNMVVMTNTGKISGLRMAKIAKASGAAALLIVNIDDKRPDDIYRLQVQEGEEGAEDIDIPVVMISMNSANVLTSATVTPNMAAEDIVNHGMPERVRLYAGGDRPFFEDVEPADPTLYLIHNLLTKQECDNLIEAAESKVSPVTKDDILQMTLTSNDVEGVHRIMLWQGLLQSPTKKAIEERIEQVTGFPATHYSDFIVDRIEPGGRWKPHYDAKEGLVPPTASITVFLSDEGGPLVYPLSKDPVKVLARKGVAVVHHNTNERQQLDQNTLHALLPSESAGAVYVARKYVYPIPVATARRLALPVFAAPFGGKLPEPVVQLHDALVENFGPETGSFYFDKLCVFFPMLLILGIAQLIGSAVHQKMTEPSATTTTTKTSKPKSGKKRKEKDSKKD